MKKIFLTGASSGIGLATAKLLCAQGHQVWGTSRRVERLPQFAGFHPVELDLTDGSSIERAWEAAWREAGGFDVLINNAGAGHFNPAASLPRELILDQFELLVFGPIRLCQAALRSMETQPRGLIINLTSLAARLPVPFTAAYNAAKAAISSFTTTMQLELGDSPIRLIDLQAADINTDFNASVRKDDEADPRFAARLQRAWQVVDKNMSSAPPPDLVTQRIARLLTEKNPPPRVTVGDFFQSRIAPIIFGLLSPRLRVWGLRYYYKI